MIRELAIASALLLTMPLALIAEEAEATEATTPAAENRQDGKPFLGLVVNEIDDAGFDGIQGLKVDRVIASQTAEQMGLQVGDILQSFNGTDVRTRADLSKLLMTAEVGSEVTASWMRGDEAHAGSAKLAGRPSRADVRDRLQQGQSDVKNLQDALANQQDDIGALAAEQASLGMGMAQLATVLEGLPEQLQKAADEFKAVYPDGEFEVSISISIKSNANSDEATTLDLSPSAAPSDADVDADAEEPAAPQAATPKPAEEEEVADVDEASGPLPPPAE